MAKRFSLADFLIRWLFASLLVLGTYNPSDYSYFGWLTAEGTEFGPVPALVGVILIIAWIVFLRATFLSIGWIGVILGGALFGCLVWLLIDFGALDIDSVSEFTWVILIVLSVMLAIGLSWSHVWRRLTGQFEVDDD